MTINNKAEDKKYIIVKGESKGSYYTQMKVKNTKKQACKIQKIK
jgi:hypothetical protein